jgi:23S rRNA pseudouridine955/2504/2580 synthase
MSPIKNIAQNKTKVTYYHVSEDYIGQRIDNFLITYLKNVPKSHIYRILRKGEVRVNKKRISPFYRLMANDSIRIPPIYIEEKAKEAPPSKSTKQLLSDRILYEDDYILVLNKPSGMSVHGGSTVRVGVIETLRFMYPKLPHLELAHRLDSETSGCLVLGKKKRILRELHSLLREGKVKKIYWALTKGLWRADQLKVEVSLHKNYQQGGKHVVEVDSKGKSALTIFKPLHIFKQASLMEAHLFTGRTHQIRVHAQHQGHSIACDDRYGDDQFNKLMREKGLKRLFLHARSIEFTLPATDQTIKVVAPLDPELENCLSILSQEVNE